MNPSQNSVMHPTINDGGVINHLLPSDAETTAAEQLGVAFESGKWCMAVFYVKDGVLRLQETCFAFPIDDQASAIQLLMNAFRRKQGLLPPGPLPMAEHLQGGDITPTE